MADSVDWSAALEAIHSRSSVTELLSLYENGGATSPEVEGAVWKHCHDKPSIAAEVLLALHQHPSEVAKSIGRNLQRSMRKQDDQVKDIDVIRRTSPLQPDIRLILNGGYTAAYSQPWWLNGREDYRATFVAFVEPGVGKMPIALVTLDSEVNMIETGGLQHKGRYALLRLLYIENWIETGTVTVHIVEAPPTDVELFYLRHPFGTEIETHATYAIAPNETLHPTAHAKAVFSDCGAAPS